MNDTEKPLLPTEETGKMEETKAPATTPESTTEEVATQNGSNDDAVATNTIIVENKVEETDLMTDQLEENKAEESLKAKPETSEETQPESVNTESEAKQEKSASVNEVSETTSRLNVTALSKLSKEEIIEKFSQLIDSAADSTRNDMEALKQAFYKIRRNEVDELKKTFIEQGNDEKDFVAPEDEAENKMKELLTAYKEKRASILAEEEKTKAENYILKMQLIDKLKTLCESQDDFNKLYNEFKDIQQKWKEIKLIPQEHANELWKEYQLYNEQFYDIIKINNQFRDYDFKKNLELKTALCEAVERLINETDVISAFHQLQKLHQQWREIGPVAKELREEIWNRFKEASTAINKRHQDYYDQQKENEKENLDAKTALCEQVEAIDYTTLKSFKDWDNKNKEVIEIQAKWKTIGYAPKKVNVKIFDRFRSACDVFFSKKGEFFKSIKADMEKNLQLKNELCEKAEALKDSTDWKNTTDKLIALQKEWKTIGLVPRKHSEQLWKRFIAACDHFFDQKNANFSSQKNAENTNLEAKKTLIEKINVLSESEDRDESFALLKGYMAEWNAIGFVPFKEKDKIYKAYHEAVDKQFDLLKVDQNDHRMQSFKNNLNDITTGDRAKGKLYSEREKLMRTYERMKSELQTYENNIGFLSVSSKGGGGLVKEMEKKIQSLKEEMELAIKKIDAIDENLE